MRSQGWGWRRTRRCARAQGWDRGYADRIAITCRFRKGSVYARCLLIDGACLRIIQAHKLRWFSRKIQVILFSTTPQVATAGRCINIYCTAWNGASCELRYTLYFAI